MNDKPVDIFLDTGANRSKEYVNNLFLNVVIKNFHDILSNVGKLQVRWGNQEILPYESYVELEVSLNNDTPVNEILVPVLITPERLHYLILGTNAIENISQIFLPQKSKNVITSLVKSIHAEKPQKLSNVKTPKHHVIIPVGEQVSVKCNMDRVAFKEKILAAFEPEPFENGDLIPIPSIHLTRRCIQNYITAPVLNRSNII